MPKEGSTFTGKVNIIATYHHPILARHDNSETVRLIATGDLEGRSPGCQFVDSTGRIHWDELSKFQVQDTNFLTPDSNMTGLTQGNQSNR